MSSMDDINDRPEDISKKAQGHKANLSNPNTSDASKENSRKVLEELGGEDAFFGKKEGEKNPNNVAGGLKSTINQSKPEVSQEARDNAQERLDGMK